MGKGGERDVVNMLQCFLKQLVGVRANGQPSATIEYVYDGNGNRYSKTITPSGGTPSTRYYSYDTSGNIVSEYKRVMVNGVEKSQALVRYVRDTGGKAISMLQYDYSEDRSSVDGQRTYYFIYNGHGDVTALTDSTGTVVATYSYDEFGNEVIGSRSSDNEQGIYNPLRYSGAHNAYYDSETASAGSAQDGLYKMGARYYQPDIGRWLTRDSYKGEQEQPQTQNRYVYVENNPLSNVDPSGHFKINLGWGSYFNFARQRWKEIKDVKVFRAYLKMTRGFAAEIVLTKGAGIAIKKIAVYAPAKIASVLESWLGRQIFPRILAKPISKNTFGNWAKKKVLGAGKDFWYVPGDGWGYDVDS